MNLQIRHKVLLPALAVISVLLALAGYSSYSIWRINRQAGDLSTFHLPGSFATREMRLLLDNVTDFGQLARVSKEPEWPEKFEAARRDLEAQIEAMVNREPGGMQPVHRRFRRTLDALYLSLEALDPNNPETKSEVKAGQDEAYADLRDLEEHYAQRVEHGVQEVARIGTVAARSTLYALAAGLVVSAIVWVLILLSLSRPLRELVSGTDRIAQGRFSEPIPVLSGDELGTLSAAFNRMAASLSEIDRMKAEFVATASHELKTPLTCIKGFASLLRSGARGPLTEEQRTTLVQVEEQVDQMAGFVSQLLDLSRLRAGRVTMNIRSLPAEAFFSSVARSFEGVAEKRGIKYEVRLGPELPARIQVDPDRMREVVYNLLGNAFKFTGQGGRIGLDVEGDSEWVRVTVSDTGPGIPQEDLPFIFEKYYKGTEADGALNNEGAGLGLAISRGIVEKHGGRIWVESAAGHGSRFIFRIPVSVVGKEVER